MSRLTRAAAAPLLRWRLAGTQRGVDLQRRLLTSPPSSVGDSLSPTTQTTWPKSGSSASAAMTVKALRVFHAREGHFAVPYRFVVPSPTSHCRAEGGEATEGENPDAEWPRKLHGFPLGSRIHGLARSFAGGKVIRSSPARWVAAQLTAMDFPLAHWSDYYFEQRYLRALETYRRLEGDLAVPKSFVVPTGDPTWPRSTWGVALGLQLVMLRKQRKQLPRGQTDALNALGFVWNASDTKWTEYFLPSLRRFHQLHGHTSVPVSFVVPADDSRWPQHLAGYRLGQRVDMVRSGQYAEQVAASRDELQQLGFSMNVSDKTWSESILPALEVFAREFGHCDVPQDFIVPAHAPWPAATWSLQLGDAVMSIRGGAYKVQTRANRAELETIGFAWNTRLHIEKKVRNVVLPALKAYTRVYGNQFVSTDFVVPESDESWPLQARGFRLGQWIQRVRGGQLELPPHLREELDAAGFFWRSSDARWTVVLLPAFRTYKDIHGSCARMPTSFVVPHAPPYPRETWGVRLGNALWHIRNGDTFVASDDKERELRALGVLEQREREPRDH